MADQDRVRRLQATLNQLTPREDRVSLRPNLSTGPRAELRGLIFEKIHGAAYAGDTDSMVDAVMGLFQFVDDDCDGLDHILVAITHPLPKSP